jgi:hypothetical protein
MQKPPQVITNLANFPTGANLVLTKTSVGFKPQNSTTYNGFLILYGA